MSARAWPSASTASAWAAPCSAGSPRPASPTAGATAPFVFAMVLVGVMAVVFWLMARDAPVRAPGRDGGMFAVAADLPRAARRLGADLLLLPRLRRLRGDVRLPAEAPDHGVHGLDKPDAAARAAGFALVAVIARPVGGWLADRVGADTDPAHLLRGDRRAAPSLLAPFYDEMVPLTILALTHGRRLRPRHRRRVQAGRARLPGTVGAVTGVVGAAGGLGGFFPRS